MISVFTCCDVRYHFRIKMMLGSSLPPVIGGLASYLRYVCLFTYSGVLHVLCCVFVLFMLVLSCQCCQFLWSVHVWLANQYIVHRRSFWNKLYHVRTKSILWKAKIFRRNTPKELKQNSQHWLYQRQDNRSFHNDYNLVSTYINNKYNW
jgi:hypothetical protein